MESINVIETRKPIRLSFPVGLRRPLYCSSIGKLLPAHQPPARSTTTGRRRASSHTRQRPSRIRACWGINKVS
ncbi:IclR family transcriptional regulator domain-containing protein [Paraburkholderia sp. WSM4174]|uniref:IclR family transcriptional regulator domain-containing protein n=1 Tax=Paraburkholderia sp. WSM4174 TaxID=2991071 RepID=UPI003D1C7940